MKYLLIIGCILISTLFFSCEDYLEKINNLEAQLSRSEDKLHTCTMYNYDFQKENRDLKKENNELMNQNT